MENNIEKPLKLNKKAIVFLDETQMNQIKGAGDFDTPTINDNCGCNDQWSMGTAGQSCNTYWTCDPGDWCGYNHETNCSGPLSTAY